MAASSGVQLLAQATGLINLYRPVDDEVSTEDGTLISNFDEYTFRAPRPGYFAGDDPRTKDGFTTCFPWVSLYDDTQIVVPSLWTQSSVSSLDVLPLELLMQVLPLLDIPSLISFRNVNLGARCIVDSISMFRSVVSYPGLLSAVLKLKSTFFNLRTLFACIQTPECSSCGHFGDLLYLITCQRWCFECWCDTKKNTPLLPFLRDMDKLPKLQHLPHVILSPGTYGLEASAALKECKVAFDHKAFEAQPDVAPWATEEPVYELRYMAMIRAPYLDKLTGDWEEGFMCRACSFQGWEFRAIDNHYRIRFPSVQKFPVWEVPWRRYTREGIEKHLEQHGRILRIEESGWGPRYVHEYSLSSSGSTQGNTYVMSAMSSILRQCRDGDFPGTPPRLYNPSWQHVSTRKSVGWPTLYPDVYDFNYSSDSGNEF